MNRGAAILLTVTCVLVVVAGLSVALADRPTARSSEFQQLVGGLGGGPALDLWSCPNGFDPCLEADCSLDVGPIPGGKVFCSCHGCTLETGRNAP
jgi:hypothetical protein